MLCPLEALAQKLKQYVCMGLSVTMNENDDDGNRSTENDGGNGSLRAHMLSGSQRLEMDRPMRENENERLFQLRVCLCVCVFVCVCVCVCVCVRECKIHKQENLCGLKSHSRNRHERENTKCRFVHIPNNNDDDDGK